jgi:hypothetical protein
MLAWRVGRRLKTAAADDMGSKTQGGGCMKSYRLIAGLLLALLVMGCAGAGKLNSVRLGMTRDEVVAVAGEPSSTSQMGNEEFLKYQLMSDWIFTDRYYVRLMNGRVDAFGRVGDFNLGF